MMARARRFNLFLSEAWLATPRETTRANNVDLEPPFNTLVATLKDKAGECQPRLALKIVGKWR